MINCNLDKVLDLIKKTGDKAIVMPEFSDPYVIVPIDHYEQMISDKVNYAEMTEQEILSRVNREISLWKQSQRELGFNPDMDFIHNINNIDSNDIDEDDDFFSDEDDYNDNYNYEEVPPPPDLPVKNSSLPIIDMSFKDSDVEKQENDFLVEPIE